MDRLIRHFVTACDDYPVTETIQLPGQRAWHCSSSVIDRGVHTLVAARASVSKDPYQGLLPLLWTVQTATSNTIISRPWSSPTASSDTLSSHLRRVSELRLWTPSPQFHFNPSKRIMPKQVIVPLVSHSAKREFQIGAQGHHSRPWKVDPFPFPVHASQ